MLILKGEFGQIFKPQTGLNRDVADIQMKLFFDFIQAKPCKVGYNPAQAAEILAILRIIEFHESKALFLDFEFAAQIIFINERVSAHVDLNALGQFVLGLKVVEPARVAIIDPVMGAEFIRFTVHAGKTDRRKIG